MIKKPYKQEKKIHAFSITEENTAALNPEDEQYIY